MSIKKFEYSAQTKIEIYKSLISDIEKQINDLNIYLTQRTYGSESLFTLIGETLEKYKQTILNAHNQQKISEDVKNNGLQHVSNILKMFLEHDINLKTSINETKGKLAALNSHKEKLKNLLKSQEKYLNHILQGNIDETGAYTGPLAQRPPGIRPADPMAARKQNK
jgi:sugar-specific transcriptional regulator TrmB